MSWWLIKNSDQLDTPALAVFPDRVKENIRILVSMVSNVDQLRPHIKTNKSPQASTLMIEAGIKNFKCATIAEAEMLGEAGAPDILLAYQPTGPKITRLADLIRNFPDSHFSCLVDDLECAGIISFAMEEKGLVLDVWIDINVGMNRTGINPLKAAELFRQSVSLKGINPIGIHAYDGHLREMDLSIRKFKCDEAFKIIESAAQAIQVTTGIIPKIVAGGSPTFPIHSTRTGVQCSPGTFIYWDIGYGDLLKEQPFQHAVVVLTRVISKPAIGLLCLDLGHKSIASENPLDKRVVFQDHSDLIPVSQSEEHLVVKTEKWDNYKVGQLIYGIPYHVCPTIALYEFSWVIKEGHTTVKWDHIARNRRISI